MMQFRNIVRGGALAALAIGLAAASPASAEEIEISNYGVGTNGMPYAVALGAGYFDEVGLDITGIRTSPGGAPTIRNLLAGDLAYGEAGLTAALAAIRGGADIKIIGTTANTVAEIGWVVMPDSPIKTIEDMKGAKLGYTNPNSTTQALALMLIKAAGLTPEEVETISTGGFGPGLAALEHGQLDVAPIVEPIFSNNPGKYRLLTWAPDALPPLVDVLAITTDRAIAQRPDFLKKMMLARQKAVQLMTENPAEAAKHVAGPYKMSPEVAEKVISQLQRPTGPDNVRYWGEGALYLPSMKNLADAQILLGVDYSDINWDEIVDDSFMPEDQKGLYDK
ncbi:ABC transporter substrate-binding protein [Microbaculum marinum]|uniref:ABC transporter substrate-binding protein n=1 Tax=Microbaculum marinum TaxID=1764581 RepID=A0AAW9RTZ3_9HYPH